MQTFLIGWLAFTVKADNDEPVSQTETSLVVKMRMIADEGPDHVQKTDTDLDILLLSGTPDLSGAESYPINYIEHRVCGRSVFMRLSIPPPKQLV